MTTKKIFMAVEFLSCINTTTGHPNKRTGRLNHAVELKIFNSKRLRAYWLEKGNHTSDMQGNCRVAVAPSLARSLHLGMSITEYNEMIDSMRIIGFGAL